MSRNIYQRQYDYLVAYVFWRVKNIDQSAASYHAASLADDPEAPPLSTFYRWIRMWSLDPEYPIGESTLTGARGLQAWLDLDEEVAIAQRASQDQFKPPRKPGSGRKKREGEKPPGYTETLVEVRDGLQRIEASIDRLAASITRVMDHLAIDGGGA